MLGERGFVLVLSVLFFGVILEPIVQESTLHCFIVRVKVNCYLRMLGEVNT